MIVLASCADEPCQHRDADDDSICDNCEESYTDGTDVHVHYFTQQNTNSKYLISTGDCVNPSIYYYSCYCGETGTETFTEGGGGAHTELSNISRENIVEATCAEDGSYDVVYRCKACNSETNRISYVTSATGAHNVENGACTVCHAKESDPRLKYRLNSDGKGYTVTGVTSGLVVKDVVIGSIYNNKNVTDIDVRAFASKTSIESVTICEGVKFIGENAFNMCDNLKSVILPGSIEGIYPGAFEGCINLTSVIFGQNSKLKEISLRVFSWCSSLKVITIPGGVETINYHAFYNCTSLASVTIQEGVKHIIYNAFEGCSSLKNITIPASVITIGSDAFKGTALTSATFINPNGWYRLNPSSSSTNKTAISSSDLANAKTAAYLLTESHYKDDNWIRS